VKAVDNLKSANVITEDVVAQIGRGSYRPTNLKVIDYCSPSDFANIVAESRVVVTHAGIGTIAQALELAKPVIVIPRRAELGECSDNHQWTTAGQLEKEMKVLVAREISELPDKLMQAERFVPVRGQGGAGIIQAVEKYLDELAAFRHMTREK
jgi:UDP-N-acetylglucosamine transferase subunit ALG13